VFDTIQTPDASTCSAATTPSAANTTTKGELLERARAAIEAGEQSLHDAAEALALAQEDFGATQREIATAVGRSASWVNRLLKWRQSGYKDNSPFGPTTTAGRVSHAKQRTKASKARKARIERSVDDDSPDTSAERRKAEYAEQEAKTAHYIEAAAAGFSQPEAEPVCAETNPASSSGGNRALVEFKYAVDHWLPMMTYEAKCEAVNYAIKKSGVPVS